MSPKRRFLMQAGHGGKSGIGCKGIGLSLLVVTVLICVCLWQKLMRKGTYGGTYNYYYYSRVSTSTRYTTPSHKYSDRAFRRAYDEWNTLALSTEDDDDLRHTQSRDFYTDFNASIARLKDASPATCIAHIFVYTDFIESDPDLDPAFKRFVMQALRADQGEVDVSEQVLRSMETYAFDSRSKDGASLRGSKIADDNRHLQSIQATDQFKLVIILLYRLALLNMRTSPSSICVTRDWRSADLLFVPVLGTGKTFNKWRQRCSSRGIFALAHLTEDNAHRHVFAVPKSHAVPLGPYCDQFFSLIPSYVSDEHTRELLRRAARVSYSDTPQYHSVAVDIDSRQSIFDSYHYGYAFNFGIALFLSKMLTRDFMRHQFDDAFQHDGFVMSIPHPSSVHWSARFLPRDAGGVQRIDPPVGQDATGATKVVVVDGDVPPWRSRHARPILLSFIGKAHGEQHDVRSRLKQECTSMGNVSACLYVDLSEPNYRDHIPSVINSAQLPFDEGSHSLLDSLQDAYYNVKMSSIFCAEPEGDSPNRKSLYDSLLLGCIPVLFSRRTYALSPLHWDSSWKRDSSILVKYSDYVSGQLNLISYLESFVDSNGSRWNKSVTSMQRSIADNAHSLQYSLDDSEEDAFARLFLLLSNRSQFIDQRLH